MIRKIFAVVLVLLMAVSRTGVNVFAVELTVDIAAVDFDGLETMAEEIQALADKCKAKGLSTDYENAKLEIIRLFTGFLREDVKKGASTQVAYTLGCLNTLHDECIDSLNAYLNGTATPLESTHYRTGTITVSGDDMYATTVGADGTQQLWFVGFGHGKSATDAMESFAALGFNSVQFEVGPQDIIVEKYKGDHTGLNDDDLFSINTSAVTDTVIPTLEKAAQCNVAVSLLLSPHYMPTFLYSLYPDLKNDNTGCQKYNIYHPVAKRVIEVYLDTLLPMIKDYDSLMEFCLTNEPHYKSSRCDYDIPAWQAYLKEKYSSIEQLNETWSTAYGSFDEVIMPRQEQATPLMYEWVRFNNDYYSSWHKWMTDIVKRNAPEIPVSAKVMSYTDEASQRIMYGVDVEQLSGFTDLNGSNGWNTLYKKNTNSKWVAYDLLNSVSDDPIINSEDHVIYDESEEFFDTEGAADLAKHCYTDVFAGGIHGRSAGIYWIWDYTRNPDDYNYGCISSRPDALAAMSKAALDLNRLSEEVNALSEDEADVAILLSNTTRVYSRMFSEYLDLAYSGAVYAGKTVELVTDNSLSQLENGKLLIIPNCCNVPAEALTAINSYIENGNKVLLLGHCLKNDEYDRPSDVKTLANIYKNAEVLGSNPFSKVVEFVLKAINGLLKAMSGLFNTKLDLGLDYAITKNILGALYSPTKVIIGAENVSDAIIALDGEAEITLRDSKGKAVDKVEIRSTEYNGKTLVSLCSQDWDEDKENVSMYLNGTLVEGTVNRLTEEMADSAFTLKPYEPVLLEF